MSKLIDRVIEIAETEVGYSEKETYEELDSPTANAGDANYTKYQRDLAPVGYFNSSKKGIAWCAVFWCWCFFRAFGETVAKKLLCQPNSGNAAAGCNSAMEYFKEHGQFFTSGPKKGDAIFFWNSDKTEASHVGIVYKTSLLNVYTIEGNTTSSSAPAGSGGVVGTQKYKLSSDRIIGYGRPRWELATEADLVDYTDTGDDVVDGTIEEVVDPEINGWVKSSSGNGVNFRVKPNATAGRVAGMKKIKDGEGVHIKTTDGTWAAIEYKGYRGYMMIKFIQTDLVADADPEADVEAEEIPEDQEVYTTVKGDTLWNISKKYLGSGPRYKEIMKANGLKSSVIRPGMVLKIPK